METKQIAVILLVIAAIAASVYIFTLPQEAPPENGNGEKEAGEYPPPFEKGKNTTLEEFASHLLFAQDVYIVEDLRGLGEKYPLSRNNIMQCAIDYAGSPGIVGKNLHVYVFEGELCTSLNGEAPISDCYGEVLEASGRMESAIIWIEKGASPEFYSRGMVVRVDENYVQGMCSINISKPDEGEEPAPPAIEEPQQEEVEGPEGETDLVEEEAPEENGMPVEPQGPGDSHTFP